MVYIGINKISYKKKTDHIGYLSELVNMVGKIPCRNNDTKEPKLIQSY